MALWSIGNRPAGTVPDGKGGFVSAQSVSSDLDNTTPVIVYPNPDGTTGGSKPNLTAPASSGDPYGGTPIMINTGASAAGLQSIAGSLGSGFSGLFDLIEKNTDKNNAWSAAQAERQMAFQERMQGIAMDFNSLEAAKNRDWQEMMSNTAHRREIEDLKAAGLNPVLSASGGNGASVGSGATAAGAAVPSGASGDPDQSANGALASIYGALINAQTQMANANLSAKTNLQMAQMQTEAQMYGAALAADASKYAAGTSYAASVYGADQSLLNQREQRQWNQDHPSNPYQLGSSIFNGMAGGSVSSAKDKLQGYSLLNFLGDISKPGSWMYNRYSTKK